MSVASKHGIEHWKRTCKEARGLARRYQCYQPDLIRHPIFRGKVGPYSICFTCNTWETPATYVGSIAVLEQIGWQTGKLWGMPAGVEIPQDAMLAVESWSKEHFDAARELLSDLFGDILKPNDDSQRAIENRGLMALSWTVEARDIKIRKAGAIHHG